MDRSGQQNAGSKMTWTCHVCGELRPDSTISVVTTDVSTQYELPSGTMKQNVRYCNDRQTCINAALSGVRGSR